MFKSRSKSASEPASVTKSDGNGLFGSLRRSLHRTRDLLLTDVGDLLKPGTALDDATLEELETRLLQADVGIDATTAIIDNLRGKARAGSDKAPLELLRTAMLEILAPVSIPLTPQGSPGNPFVLLMVGVNGAGKTTTLGKLAARYQAEGHQVLLAAGDTFRHAAIEQLQTWGERSNLPVIAQSHGSDAASVVYDAISSARARGCDVVLADTAGRLHTKTHLMTELQKVRRVLDKFEPRPAFEIMLVLDAGTGQNALVQAREFNQLIGLTGITLTKLDGTAKGGVVFALAQSLQLPIRYIGVGEGLTDLRPFSAEQFVDALLTDSVD
ncbi:MAG: signal recognition particle-docking protein FtsY [Gammaproteobacteria bacterium]